MLRRKNALCAAALGLMLTTSLLHAAQSYEVTVERGVTATMRDGVILRADIYRPKTDGQFPVLLTAPCASGILRMTNHRKSCTATRIGCGQ